MRVYKFREAVGKTVRCTLLGDIALEWEHHGQLIERGEGFKLLESVSSYLKQSDCVVANLETVVSDSCPRLTRAGILLRSPKITAGILRAAGIHVVNLANNHVMDCGKAGIDETLSNLEDAGIGYFGAGIELCDSRKTYICDLHGIRMAMIGRTDIDWYSAGKNRAGTAPFSFKECRRCVETARADGADIVMFYLHGGEELYQVPWPKRVKKLRAIAQVGADFVIGNHQHIYQGFENCDGKIVIFSLGNFLFDNPSHRGNALACCSCMTTVFVDNKGCSGIELVPVEIQPDGVRIASKEIEDKLFSYLDSVNKLISEREIHQREWERECYQRRYEPALNMLESASEKIELKKSRLTRFLESKEKTKRLRSFLRSCYVIIQYSHYRAIYFAAKKQLYKNRLVKLRLCLSVVKRGLWRLFSSKCDQEAHE